VGTPGAARIFMQPRWAFVAGAVGTPGVAEADLRKAGKIFLRWRHTAVRVRLVKKHQARLLGVCWRGSGNTWRGGNA